MARKLFAPWGGAIHWGLLQSDPMGGPLALKGFVHPVAAFRVLGLQA